MMNPLKLLPFSLAVSLYLINGTGYPALGESRNVPRVTTSISYSYSSGFHLLTVDLEGDVHFETVFANDSYGSNREYADSMAARYGAIAAVNTDYFGSNQPPDGMAYRQGQKYKCDCWRSSLAISKDNRISIARGFTDGSDCQDQHAQGCVSTRTSLDFLFNVIGGGPQFILNGQAYWNRDLDNLNSINGEGFVDSLYWDQGGRKMTAMGVTQDGRYLKITVSDSGKTPLAAAQFLVSQNAWTGMKFDGGDSSQLYYDGQFLVPGGRPIPEGLLILPGAYTTKTIWLWDNNSTENWSINNANHSFSQGKLILSPTTSDPQLLSPILSSRSMNFIRFNAAFTASTSQAQIFFSDTSLAFSPTRKIDFQVQGGGSYYPYSFSTNNISGFNPTQDSRIRTDPPTGGNSGFDFFYTGNDGTVPSFSFDSLQQPNSSSGVTVTWSGADPYANYWYEASGIDHYEIQFDGDIWVNQGLNTTWSGGSEIGSHTLKGRAIDVVGNVSSESSVSWEVIPSGPCGPPLPPCPSTRDTRQRESSVNAISADSLPPFSVADWAGMGIDASTVFQPGGTYRIGYTYHLTRDVPVRWGLFNRVSGEWAWRPAELGMKVSVVSTDWRPYWSAPFTIGEHVALGDCSLRLVAGEEVAGSLELMDVKVYEQP